MKLMIAIVQAGDDAAVVRALLSRSYRVTRVASRGAFLRGGSVTLLVGVDEEQVQGAMDAVRQACSPTRPDGEHGVTLFVVNAAMEQL